jgi:hypothetical protein
MRSENHLAAFGPDHTPPSGGGFAITSCRSAMTSAVSGETTPGLSRRRSPSPSGPSSLYRRTNVRTHGQLKVVIDAVFATPNPLIISRMTCQWRLLLAFSKNRVQSVKTANPAHR